MMLLQHWLTMTDCRYGSADVRYAICSVIMQRVVGMAHVSREDQQHAHAYALKCKKGVEENPNGSGIRGRSSDDDDGSAREAEGGDNWMLGGF